MKVYSSHNRFASELRSLLPRDINVAIGVSALIAAANALWIAWELLIFFQAKSKADAQGAEIFYDMAPYWMQVRIAIALIINAACLCFRRNIGLIVSLLALVWVGVEYGQWYSLSLKVKAVTEDYSRLSTPHTAGLYGATGWNIVVLVVTVVLFIWEMKMLVGIIITSRKHGTLTLDKS